MSLRLRAASYSPFPGSLGPGREEAEPDHKPHTATEATLVQGRRAWERRTSGHSLSPEACSGAEPGGEPVGTVTRSPSCGNTRPRPSGPKQHTSLRFQLWRLQTGAGGSGWQQSWLLWRLWGGQGSTLTFPSFQKPPACLGSWLHHSVLHGHRHILPDPAASLPLLHLERPRDPAGPPWPNQALHSVRSTMSSCPVSCHTQVPRVKPQATLGETLFCDPRRI